MKAAVVSSFSAPPRYGDWSDPEALGPDELVVDVLASGLHPRVRSQANGSHYTSTGDLPLVPGVDGVGRGPDGVLRYFALSDTTLGAMAERTVVDTRRSVELPADADPVLIAAAMNPAMSSWVALRQRITFEPGGAVMVLGATGSAGRMAVQVARRLGADRVIGAGRNADRLQELPALGATLAVELDDPEIGSVAADVDVVLDYVWGPPAAAVMAAVITARKDRGRPLAWIQIGSVGGVTAPIPSAALRAARLQIVGSGQGSVGARELVAELPGLAAEITSGALSVEARAVPLADVEAAWSAPAGGKRLVFVP